MANFPIYHGITLAENSWIENVVFERLATDPVPVEAGRIWYNTTEKQFKYSTLDSGGAVVVRAFASAESLISEISTLTVNLAAETSARTSADNALQTSINSVNTTLTNAINAEVARATAAETALQAAIDNIGTAFEYVGTVEGDASMASATDISLLAQAAPGD